MQSRVQYNFERDYQEEIFLNREEGLNRQKYSAEKKISHLISEGEVGMIENILHEIKPTELGKMVHHPLKKQLYATIIGIGVASRAAIEGGMNEEEAYTRGDLYIRQSELCRTVEALRNLYIDMILDFAKRVREVKKEEKPQLSDLIESSINYILGNLHKELTLKSIAQQASLSENYFCTLFKKETGETVSEFIQRHRVQEAKSLLQYSEYTLIEITQYLGFCTQSYFSQVFRKYVGMSPGQYRQKNFRRVW